jgi:GT2 family glycosyltransferase
MNAAPLVSILIVTYRQHEAFGRCFRRVHDATKGLPVEAIVVVNGVTLEREHELASQMGAVLVRPPVNLGLPGGLHAARAQARGRYLAILQDDVEVQDGWLEPLVQVLDEDPSVGAVASRVELVDGSLQHEGWIVWRDALLTPLGDPDQPGPSRPVDAGGTASLLVRAEAWDDVGGPNLDLFPLWYVDVDFCLSLQEAGWNVMVQPQSIVRHHRHASTTSAFRAYLQTRQQPRVLARHASTLGQRPTRATAPEAIAAQIRRCEEDAARRRAEARPSRARLSIETRSMGELTKRATRQSRALRCGYPIWYLKWSFRRVGARLRRDVLRVLRRPSC